MKKSHEKDIIAMLILFPGLLLWSQDNKFTIEINEQVWMTFIRAFGNEDEGLFKSIHSKDVVRVIQDDGEIFGYGHYFKKIPDSLKAKWAIWKKNIEVRFTQRISSEDKAFEVGFYKTTSTNIQTGEQRKALVVFTYCYEKKMEPGKLLWMLTPREGLQRKVSKKPSPCSYNCFPITAKINFSFEKNPELYNKR